MKVVQPSVSTQWLKALAEALKENRRVWNSKTKRIVIP